MYLGSLFWRFSPLVSWLYPHGSVVRQRIMMVVTEEMFQGMVTRKQRAA